MWACIPRAVSTVNSDEEEDNEEPLLEEAHDQEGEQEMDENGATQEQSVTEVAIYTNPSGTSIGGRERTARQSQGEPTQEGQKDKPEEGQENQTEEDQLDKTLAGLDQHEWLLCT
ncbi:hypothetical protein IFM47457_07669 [Aspergillus lentulus]|nr:hypothetical protein IFM47457_07669 [Aspergillus lentulus]